MLIKPWPYMAIALQLSKRNSLNSVNSPTGLNWENSNDMILNCWRRTCCLIHNVHGWKVCLQLHKIHCVCSSVSFHKKHKGFFSVFKYYIIIFLFVLWWFPTKNSDMCLTVLICKGNADGNFTVVGLGTYCSKPTKRKINWKIQYATERIT